jgi:RNA polymerase primary sigma factor
MTKSPPRALRERDAARYLDELPERAPPDEVAERRLIELAKAGDDRAKERLVEAFLPRIAAIARHYRVGGAVNRVELVQEGVVGLLRALERYRPAGGNPFWGYASWWVRQATQQLVAELTRPIVLSDRALRQLSRLRDAHAALLREGEVEPSLRALAGRAGLGDEEVENC